MNANPMITSRHIWFPPSPLLGRGLSHRIFATPSSAPSMRPPSSMTSYFPACRKKHYTHIRASSILHYHLSILLSQVMPLYVDMNCYMRRVCRIVFRQEPLYDPL